MNEKWHTYTRFFVITILIAMGLFLCTFVIVSAQWIGNLPTTMEEVESFSLDATISASHPVTILSSPDVVLDLNHTGKSAHDYVLSGEGVYYPRFFFFGNKYVAWDDLRNIKQPTETRDRFLFGVLLFMLPSIIFWVGLWSILKLFLVFVFLIMIGYTMPRFVSHRMSFSETVKAATLAMPSVMFIGVGLAPILPQALWWWGFFLTLGVFAVSIFILSERVGRRGKV